MIFQEEKLLNFIKLSFYFLITLLGVSLTSEMFVVVLLLFYISFIRD